MHLYHFPLLNATGITKATVGNFSGSKQQEICVCRGESLLELLVVDTETGRVQTLLSHDVFGVVRSIMAFRMTGGHKDYVVVGSDSGRIVMLEYNPERNVFEKVHQETFGKTGCRRYIPGEYLAADPRGRAVLIGACERQKFVYVINRDNQARMTISSPLEAHKAHTLIYSVVGLDVGFENPIFACLELDMQESDQDHTGDALKTLKKALTFYELDLGLNHVIRKWSDPVDRSANLLIPLPGTSEGPGGVLVCSENWITWKNQSYNDVRVPIPRRRMQEDDLSHGVLITSFYVHKMKRMFFILLQSELGDLYKLTINYHDDEVKELRMKYYDTVPTSPALCILRSGFLFVPAECGNHHLYQIESLADEESEDEVSSLNVDPSSTDLFYFSPHPIQHLAPIAELDNWMPLIDAKLYNLNEDDTCQIYALCGRGARSSFRIMRRGLEASEIVSYPLPGSPIAVWTLKTRLGDEFDSYIVISFVNATLVLSIGETVEEVTDSGFLTTSPTLQVHQIGEDALIQIYPHGLRHIQADKRVNEWKAPREHPVTFACANNRQVALALANGDIVYFELDNHGQLNEYQERREITAQVYCLAIGPVPEGRQRSPFLAVGCGDQTVRILSLDPETCLEPLGMQVLDALPSSLLINEMIDFGSDVLHTTLFLHIGLSSGVLLRTVLDVVTGSLSDTRSRYLGPLPIKLFEVTAQNTGSVLALTNRPWLSYTYQNRYRTTPLTYEKLDFAANFKSEQCPEGVVGIAGNTLRILTIDRIDNEFNTTTVGLKCTPRQLALEPVSRHFVIVEADHRARLGNEDNADNLPVEQFGLPAAPAGMWASCIRVVNPFDGETTQLLQMENNEAAMIVTTCIFHSDPTTAYVIVGAACDLQLAPRKSSGGFVYVFRMSEQNTLELIHKTELEEAPTAFCAFQGRLLIGMGKVVRIYDLGKRKLLRKCEHAFPNLVVAIDTQGDRVVVSDVQESTHFARYVLQENRFHVFCDDHKPRWITRAMMLDFHTVAAADKFGNFFINRLPSDLVDEDEIEAAKSKTLSDKSFLNGATFRLNTATHYYVGDIITSLSKTPMVAGGRDVIVYTTLCGEIGIFAPLPSRDDAEFFQMLETQMRAEAAPLCGRDHLAYRSYFMPVRCVIDGKLIEQFIMLPGEKKKKIAEEFERPISELVRQIELIRARVS